MGSVHIISCHHVRMYIHVYKHMSTPHRCIFISYKFKLIHTAIPWFVQLNSQLSFVMLMVMKMVTLGHRNLVKTLGATGMKQHKW